MDKTDTELAHKRLLGFVWLSLVCFFNTAPLFLISVLANLDSVRFYNCLILISHQFLMTYAYFVDQSIYPFPANVVSVFSFFVCHSVGCVAGIHFWTFQLLPAHHHALVDQGTFHFYTRFNRVTDCILLSLWEL
jgi:hypothetical protein